MTTAPTPPPVQRKNVLRRRMITYLLLLVVIPTLSALSAMFYVISDNSHQIHGAQFIILIAVCGVLSVFLAWRMADYFLLPILEIRRGAEIVSRINLGHRIELSTGDELEDLAMEFNNMAENLGKAYAELEGRIAEATVTLQEERNRLATVLRTMVDGVIVANEASEVLLMNPRARMILDLGYTSGIGMPLSRIFPGERVAFHMKRLNQRWNHGGETMEDVVFPLANKKLFRGSLSIIPGPTGERSGYLLVFRDLSSTVDAGDIVDEILREMPRLLRGPLAASSSMVETLLRHRDMPLEKQRAFLAGVSEEMSLLGNRVVAIEEASSAAQSARWSAIPSNPRELLEEALQLVPGISVEIEGSQLQTPPVLVEPFSWVASLRCVLQWVQAMSTPACHLKVVAGLNVEDGTVVTNIRISGACKSDPAELESLMVSSTGEESMPLGEAVRKNRGELWTRSSGDSLDIRLALMQSTTVTEVRSNDGLIEGEPEFYDFDLFLPKPVIEREEQLLAKLADLEYVVFDTETTGMRLSEGDKIISISGVRIRRGRIQNAETFNALVNPGRLIPPESMIFHHINDDMVANAPHIGQVYPQFAEFVGDSVLVAHNAAFDKKCLELASAETGLPLIDNPILDTIFLSYGIHEGATGHSLEAISARMGVVIEGRHTSMGDARATAQIFLGLLALLPGRGVHTLAEAKAFCDRQLLLRWQSSRY